MERRPRILAFFIDPYFKYGKFVTGLQRRFLEISSHLRTFVDLYALEYASSLTENWGYPTYNSIKLSQRFRKHRILDTIRLLLNGLMACIKYECDLIYVPCREVSGGLYVIPPFLISLICRKPLVIVFHHLHEWDYHEKNPIKLMAYFKATCIAVSKATAKDVRRNFNVRHIFVTGNGVKLNTFRSSENTPKLYDAVYFGRIAKEKGITTLLHAWKLIVELYPKARLLMMGSSEENTQHFYTEMIEKLGIIPNVTFTGFVADEQAAKMLSESRIFILPSTAEGFGLVVLEAMSAGLPCILSDLSALRENFDEAALFVKPKDVTGFAESIKTLMFQPEKYKRLKENGEKLAKQFTWEIVAQRELKVFRNALNL